MADLGAFFSKVLGGQRAPQQPQPQQPYYPTPQSPPVYPPGQQPYQNQPAGSQVPQQAPDGSVVMAALKAGKITLGDAVQHGLSHPPARRDTTKAGEIYNCPECGGGRYFTRDHLRDKRSGVSSPAPMCMDCGYNGLIDSTIGQAVPMGTPEWGAQ